MPTPAGEREKPSDTAKSLPVEKLNIKPVRVQALQEEGINSVGDLLNKYPNPSDYANSPTGKHTGTAPIEQAIEEKK